MSDLSLSQAIRVGAALRPQARFSYFDDGIYTDDGVKVGTTELGSCAIGAAYEAKFNKTGGLREGPAMRDQLYPAFPALDLDAKGFDSPCNCAMDQCSRTYDSYDLHRLVCHLNTGHQWTRERIADWLEAQGL